MQTTQHAGHFSAYAVSQTRPKGILESPDGVMIELWKRDWKRAVARVLVREMPTTEVRETALVKYERLVLENVFLTCTTGIFLLQGGSLSSVFDGVYLPFSEGEEFKPFLLVQAAPVVLHSPPLRIPRIILAHPLEIDPSRCAAPALRQEIFLAEASAS